VSGERAVARKRARNRAHTPVTRHTTPHTPTPHTRPQPLTTRGWRRHVLTRRVPDTAGCAMEARMARPPSDTGARPGAGTGAGTGVLLGAGGAATAGPGPPAPDAIVSCPHQRSTVHRVAEGRGRRRGGSAGPREEHRGGREMTNHCCGAWAPLQFHGDPVVPLVRVLQGHPAALDRHAGQLGRSSHEGGEHGEDPNATLRVHIVATPALAFDHRKAHCFLALLTHTSSSAPSSYCSGPPVARALRVWGQPGACRG
jgi:hypothetical protein